MSAPVRNNVLVIGSGAREHSIAWKLRQSKRVGQVWIAPGNSAPFSVAQDGYDWNDVDSVRKFCVNNKVTLVIIGPEKEICSGWADKLAQTCDVFAPSQSASMIEASKAFAKDFMRKHCLPTAEYQTFNNQDDAVNYIKGVSWRGVVVKQDGLCGGKGVTVHTSKEEASRRVCELFSNSSEDVVIEEFLEGYEISALCFTDGTTVRVMPFSQDRKRVGEGDTGENTGGMGAIAPIVVTVSLEQEINELLQKSVDALRASGTPYKGVLYAGLMVTPAGPKILEFNCRFGDPETEVLMRLLDSDLYDICEACCSGKLSQVDVKWSRKKAIGIVLASTGYPGAFQKGIPIKHLPKDDEHTTVFHAGMKQDVSFGPVNSSGRVMCITSTGKSFFEAKSRCLHAVESIDFASGHYRRDIGHFVFSRTTRSLEYASSGVNIDEGNELVHDIKAYVSQTLSAGTEQIGGFGALVDLAKEGFSNPQLVIGMDGVGTKIEIASQMGKFDGLGHDLVGMCVNDVLCHGARPVAFLDYYVTGKLDRRQAAQVIRSVADACLKAGCALVGGETAEMPGVYLPHQWDLAGCSIGAREKSWPELPDVKSIQCGDVLIGLPSNGLHSNGFSLVRRILRDNNISLNDACPWAEDSKLGEELLRPTEIYVKQVLPAVQAGLVKAISHITGGGITENLPRTLPDGVVAEIDCSAWDVPPVFKWVQRKGPVAQQEMFRTLNCGIGLVLVASAEQEASLTDALKKSSASPVRIGRVVADESNSKPSVRYLNDESIFDSFDPDFVHRKRVNVGILISGTGSNMRCLIDQSQRPGSNVVISVVISNKAEALGLMVARDMGVESIVVSHLGRTRPEFEMLVDEELRARDIELICLAGFMRILTGEFVDRWRNRIINVHPALLPSFKGAHAVKLALEAKVKITGCTAHYVVEDIDAGEILGQEAVIVEDSDTEETLHKRIQVKEHQMFPRVMEDVARQLLQQNHPSTTL